MAVQTFTHTWTHTRLETIQDQFRYFMTYGNVRQGAIDDIVYGVGEKAVQAVGLYACDSSGLRVIEARLSVDWELSAELSLSIPNLGGLTGWDNTQAPEVKVAGRRFAEAAERLQLKISFWVLLLKTIRDDEKVYEAWCKRLGLGGGPPPVWKDPPEELAESLFDLPEVRVAILRAGGS
jgi:hypothetical protein